MPVRLKRFQIFVLVAASVVALTVAAMAHAHLRGSTPVAGATLKSLPPAVVLNFTEPVQAGFGTFAVLPLAVSPSAPLAQQRAAALALVENGKLDLSARVDASIRPRAALPRR